MVLSWSHPGPVTVPSRSRHGPSRSQTPVMYSFSIGSDFYGHSPSRSRHGSEFSHIRTIACPWDEFCPMGVHFDNGLVQISQCFLMTDVFNQEIMWSSNAPPSVRHCATMFLKKHSRHRVSWLGLFIPTTVNLAEDGIFLHPLHVATFPLRVSSLRVPSKEGWDQWFHTWSRRELQVSVDLQHMPGDQRWR